MNGQRTLFIEIIMGVVLGAVLLAIADVVSQNPSVGNFQAVLLVIALLIFAEMYLGLVRYHIKLEVNYVDFYLYFDILLGLLFVIFVELIKDSIDDLGLVGPAMLFCAVVFAALAIRNVIPYRRIQDLDTKLAQTRIKKQTLYIPIYFNLVGIVACFCIYFAQENGAFLTLALNSWIWLSFVLFILYAFLMNMTKISLR